MIFSIMILKSLKPVISKCLGLMMVVKSFFLGLIVFLPVIKEILDQDRPNTTSNQGLPRCVEASQRSNAGGWDCIGQVS